MPKKLTTEEFIKRSKKIHGDKYDYSLVETNDIYNKVKIICPTHGVFEQATKSHLKGYECKICGQLKSNKNRTSNTEEFIKKAKEIHGDEYDYSLVDYKTAKTNVKIICLKHGVFEQTPTNHIHKTNKTGCSMCYGTKKRTTEEFIIKAKEIHGDKYDYSLIEYIKSDIRVKIICKEHGIFTQTPQKHLHKRGCPICNCSKGESQISNYLKDKKISFKTQYSFKKCRNVLPLFFDFYLPSYNLCIEYDGIQHFKPIDRFGGENEFKTVQIRDNIKNNYCYENNIKLLRIKYDENIIEKLDSYINI
jgi:very-short-patch-repair endonuclease